MRIFQNFSEAFGEIKRDLGEMGIPIHTTTMQDKNIEGDESYATVELQDYIYKVTAPDFQDLSPVQPWADEEWCERLAGCLGTAINPGEAYKLRPDVWDEFLRDGKFGYSYPDRLAEEDKVLSIIKRIGQDPSSRQLYLPMFKSEDCNHFGSIRVPCSLGWHFQIRGGKLNMMYFMRSCDFSTHFQNDVYLAHMLQTFIAKETGYPVGTFGQYMASLHVYQKDIADVF